MGVDRFVLGIVVLVACRWWLLLLLAAQMLECRVVQKILHVVDGRLGAAAGGGVDAEQRLRHAPSSHLALQPPQKNK